MHNILRRPAPRLQEDKTSGFDAHFPYIDAYVHAVKKSTPAALRGGAPRLRLVVRGSAPRAGRLFYALWLVLVI